jgi:hypothetical protein
MNNNLTDFNDPAFLAWLAQTEGFPFEPDDKDHIDAMDEPGYVPPTSQKTAAEAYRKAEAKKIQRLHAKWKAAQN